jgi:hypothetical protein
MANDRKRKEAQRSRKREQRAVSREDSQTEVQPNDSRDMQASCSTGKRRRLDSSAASSTSVRSNASTSSERVSKHRANMTEEQKAAVRAKDAERKRKSRANKSEDQKATERTKNAARMRRNRSDMSEEMRVDNQKKDTSARQYARSNTPSESTERSNTSRRERRHELSEMRASFLQVTPPDSSTTPRAQTIEEAFGIPFFQSTKGLCYCRTALNNALGGNVFSYESLGVANIDNVNIELSETAIREKLVSQGVRCESQNNVRDLLNISEISTVATWILRNNTTGGHYIVVKRLQIDGPLWLLDSAKQAPEVSASYFYDIAENLRSEDELRDLFLIYLRFPEGYVPQCIRDRSEVGIRRMFTTVQSNDCFVLINDSYNYVLNLIYF